MAQYFISIIDASADPTERYWSYIGISKIKGRLAHEFLNQYLDKETDQFAANGLKKSLNQ